MLRESPPSQFDNPAFEGADDQVLFDKTAIGNVGAGRRLPFTRKHVILLLLAIGVIALLFGNIWAGWGTWNKATVPPGVVFPTANPLDGSTVYINGISQVTLDGGLFIALNWKIDQSSVNFTLSWTNSTGPARWYLLGFGDREKLQGSDFCLYYDGKLTDGYITPDGGLKRDLQQDCELISSTNGSVTFRRRFSTCDVRDYAFDRGTTHFIFASGNGTAFPETLPPVTAFRQAWPLRKFVETKFTETTTLNLTFGAADATIAEAEKSAWCTISKTELPHKNHIIRVEPAISLGNEELVRSIQLTHCSYAGKDDISYNGPCDKLAPGTGALCDKHLIASWTHGAPALDYPPAAGFPIGGSDGPVFLLSRVTYVNPSKLSGLSDNSTLILTVTDQLRPNDAGVFQVGQTGQALAVPKSGSVTVSALCPEKCTQNGLPEYGITVFASMLESTANAISVEVLRQDGTTALIDSDEHSTTQVPIVFPTTPLINIHKGDSITTFCKLSPESDVPPACGAHLFYYPAMPLAICRSAISNETLTSWLKDHSLQNLADANTSDLQELYASAPVDASCLNFDDNLILGSSSDWLNLSKPKNVSPLISKRPEPWQCPSIST